MTTADELLSNPGWRRRNSLWILWSLATAGVLSCVGFLYTGIRMREPVRITIGFVGALLTSATLATMAPEGEPQSLLNTILVNMTPFWWIGTSITAFLMNRRWLIWKANQPPKWPTAPASPTQQSQQFAAPPTSYAQPQAFAAPLPGATAGSTQLGYASLLDLNSASREQLLALPGINAEWADYLVALRGRLGGFGDKNEIVIDGKMPPHMYLQIRDLVTVTPRTP